MATHGSVSSSDRHARAVLTAMSANCSTVGSGTTPVSAKISQPAAPIWGSAVPIMLHALTVLLPSATPTPKIALLTVSLVRQLLPETMPSTHLSSTIIEP